MSVESFLLPEFLIAWCKSSALILFSLCFMDLLVKFQTLAGVKGLAATFIVTDMVADIFVLGLDMMLEVALSQKRLVAVVKGADKRTFICMGALMFGQSDRTSVGLAASWIVTEVFLLSWF